jgi:hypothetical protein
MHNVPTKEMRVQSSSLAPLSDGRHFQLTATCIGIFWLDDIAAKKHRTAIPEPKPKAQGQRSWSPFRGL